MKRNYCAAWLSLVFVAGAIFRTFHMLSWAKTPYFSGFFLDELYHHLWAKQIASGEIFSKGVFFRAPLYPYMLGAIYFVFGDGGLAPRVFQHLLGLLAIFPIYFTTKEIFGKNFLAIWAALIWALCPIQIFYESRILLDALFAAGIPWLVWFCILFRRKRSLSLCAIIGILLGILAIIRPTILVVTPLVIIFLWKHVRWQAIVALCAIAIPVLPVTISNMLNGDFVAIASQGGINFYIGNNPQSDGASAIVPEFGHNWQYRQCVAFAQREKGAKLKPSQVSRFFFKKGLDFWINQPMDALRLLTKKIILLLTSPEVGNNGNTYFLTRTSPLRFFLWSWAIFLPLTVVGLIFKKFQHRWFFLWFILVYGVSIVAFFVSDRFRLPLLPVMSVVSAAGVSVLYDSLRRRQILPIILASAIAGASLIDPYGWRKSDDALSHFALGNINFRKGNLNLALAEYRLALEKNPSMRGVNLNMGALFFKMGQVDSARSHFKREIDIGGEKCRALSNLGVIARLDGDFQQAIYLGQKSVADCEPDPASLYNYALTLHLAGYHEAADSILDSASSEFPENLRILNLRGAIALAQGKTEIAESIFISVFSAKSSDFIELYDLGTIYSQEVGMGTSDERIKSYAYFNLAQISIGRGDTKKAEEFFTLSIFADSTFAQGYSGLGMLMLARNRLAEAESLLLRAQNLGYSSPELFFNLASISARKGDLESAVAFLKKTIEIAPEFEPAKKALAAIEDSLRMK